MIGTIYTALIESSFYHIHRLSAISYRLFQRLPLEQSEGWQKTVLNPNHKTPFAPSIPTSCHSVRNDRASRDRGATR